MSSFLRVIFLSAGIVAATIAAVVLVSATANRNSTDNRIDRVKDRERRHLRSDRQPDVELPSAALDLRRKPAALWTVRRQVKYAHDLASQEIDPGSGPAGIAPFSLSLADNRLVWNTTLRSYLVDTHTGRQVELAGCGDVNVADLDGDDLLVESCGTVRRARLDGAKVRSRWSAPFDSIGETSGNYAIAYRSDGDDAAVLDLRSGEVLHRFDHGDAEAITLDAKGRIALAEGIYGKDAEEWDIPTRIRVRVLDRDGDEEWDQKLDIEPNGLSLSLDGDTLTVSNWDLNGREHVVEARKGESPKPAHIAQNGDVLAEQAGYKVIRGAMDGKLRITSPDGTSKPFGPKYTDDWTTVEIEGDTILVATEGALHANRRADGRPLWTIALPSLENDATAERSIVVTENAIFIAGPSALVAIGNQPRPS